MERVTGVRSFVGVDAHSGYCTLKAYAPEGELLLKEDAVPTQVQALRKVLEGLPRPIWVLLEACPAARFVKGAIESAVDRVIACETRVNRWIAKSEDKGDPADADRLARLLRMGEFKEVHVPMGVSADRRELVWAYAKSVGDVTRVKNRLKAKFRQHGIAVSGDGVYGPAGREAWLRRLRRKQVRRLVERLYVELDVALEGASVRLGWLQASVRRVSAYKRLREIPGVGPVVASILIGVIDDPFRFTTKNQLRRYAGLSVRRAVSMGRPVRPEGGAYSGNRLLKNAVMTAAQTAVVGTNRFARQYVRLLEEGQDRGLAKKTVARSILTTAWSIWRNGTAYRDVL